MTLGSLFGKDVVAATSDVSIGDVAQLMHERHVGAVVVVGEQRIPVGIVTDRDVALALGVRQHSAAEPVEHIMTRPVTTLDWDEGILDATRTMREAHVRRLPVVDERGRLVGLASLDDLLILLGRELFNLGEGIRPEVEPALAAAAAHR